MHCIRCDLSGLSKLICRADREIVEEALRQGRKHVGLWGFGGVRASASREASRARPTPLVGWRHRDTEPQASPSPHLNAPRLARAAPRVEVPASRSDSHGRRSAKVQWPCGGKGSVLCICSGSAESFERPSLPSKSACGSSWWTWPVKSHNPRRSKTTAQERRVDHWPKRAPLRMGLGVRRGGALPRPWPPPRGDQQVRAFATPANVVCAHLRT